ncbi:hypothetical protein VUR80DRAFT_2611 [Thermomyces stellatus]
MSRHRQELAYTFQSEEFTMLFLSPSYPQYDSSLGPHVDVFNTRVVNGGYQVSPRHHSASEVWSMQTRADRRYNPVQGIVQAQLRILRGMAP